jgi:hypothetical protein
LKKERKKEKLKKCSEWNHSQLGRDRSVTWLIRGRDRAVVRTAAAAQAMSRRMLTAS